MTRKTQERKIRRGSHDDKLQRKNESSDAKRLELCLVMCIHKGATTFSVKHLLTHLEPSNLGQCCPLYIALHFFRLTLPTMCGGNVSVRIPRPAPKRTVYERKMTCGTFFSDMFFEHFFLFFLVCKTEILPVADSRPRHANPIRCGGAMLTPLGILPAVRAELWPHLPVIEFASLSFCSSFRVQIAQHRRTFWSLPFVGRWLRRHFRDEYRGCKGAAHGSTI